MTSASRMGLFAIRSISPLGDRIQRSIKRNLLVCGREVVRLPRPHNLSAPTPLSAM
ncbi:MAG: hypothetical protein AAGA75_17245 [Cyanobacteria bacterium P01_E01_bin.6]